MKTLNSTICALELMKKGSVDIFTLEESYKHSFDSDNYICYLTVNKDDSMYVINMIESFFNVNVIKYSEMSNEVECQVKGSDIRFENSISELIEIYYSNIDLYTNDEEVKLISNHYNCINKEFLNIIDTLEQKELEEQELFFKSMKYSEEKDKFEFEFNNLMAKLNNCTHKILTEEEVQNHFLNMEVE